MMAILGLNLPIFAHFHLPNLPFSKLRKLLFLRMAVDVGWFLPFVKLKNQD